MSLRYDPEFKAGLQEYLKNAILQEILACPCCGSADLVHYGYTRKGTPRCKCKRCGKIRCIASETMRNTKLPREIWERYIPMYMNGISPAEASRVLGVSVSTAYLMRKRLDKCADDYIFGEGRDPSSNPFVLYEIF